jgi:predicted phosphoribosyltransferase
MSDLIQRLENRGTYDDAYGLSDWAVAEAFRALTAENAALALQVQRARDDALEEAAQTASERHLAWQDQAGACLVDDDISACSDIAAAIRALRCATEGAGG